MNEQQTRNHHRAVKIFPVAFGLLLILALCTGWVSAGVFLKNGSDISDENPAQIILSDHNTTPKEYSIAFFYNTNCGACHLAMTYLTEYSLAHPGVIINSYDLFNSSDNKVLFDQYKTAYHRPYVSVPTVFIGNAGLEGEPAIRDNFEELATWYEQNKGDTTELPEGIPADSSKKTHRTVISIPLVLIAGLVDGINPCASAVLIFLLILLMSIRQKQRTILIGLIFSCAVYGMYFVSGAGFYTLFSVAGILKWYSLGVSIIAMVAGVLLIKDSVAPLKGVAVRLPESVSNALSGKIIPNIIPIAFILGLLIGVLELSCTGGIYLAIQDMITFRVNIAQGLVYLILYNLAFIIPLLIITGLVYWWMPDHQEDDVRDNKTALRTFSGLLLFVFAFLILSGVM